MAMKVIELRLAIPLETWDKIPLAKKQAALQVIKDLKALSVRVNDGQINEEMTVMARMHICHHDEGSNHPPCEDWQEI